MKHIKHFTKNLFAVLAVCTLLLSCSATVKVPKHPAPGEPPQPPPKVEIHNN